MMKLNNKSSFLMTKLFSLKKEGRGGAIYLNPAFQHERSDPKLFMSRVNINDCTFTNNFAFNGHGIYIEVDDPDTTFTIKNNEFKDNYDKSHPSNYNAIILTEIYSIYNSDICTTNNFINSDTSISKTSVLYVDHNELPFTTPPISEDPNYVDELEIINI